MKFTKTILKNGLRVITVPIKDNPAVTVLVMVEAGSKYETKEINGISHFLEHMVFKGTTKRPQASDISRELDSLGSQYNAFTSQEYTGYYAKVAPHHLDKALEIVSDMYLNPLFDEKEMEKEKGVIIEEIKMYKDLPHRHVHDVLERLLYGDTPAGWPITGPEENIRSFNKNHFVDYRNKNYVSKATTVIISGNIKEKEIIKKVENAFTTISTKQKSKKEKVKENQSKPEIEINFKETDQTHLALGIRTFSVFDKKNPTMKVLTTILGQGMSSRLFTKMRDELGICYYIRAHHDVSTDHGHLTIAAGLDNKRVEIGLEHILIELKRMKDEPVSEAELKKAKDYIAGTTMLELETSDSQAEYAAYQEVLKGKIELPEKNIADIQKVSSKDIQKLAKEIFVDEGLNMAIIGHFKDKNIFEKLLTFKK